MNVRTLAPLALLAKELGLNIEITEFDALQRDVRDYRSQIIITGFNDGRDDRLSKFDEIIDGGGFLLTGDGSTAYAIKEDNGNEEGGQVADKAAA